MTQVKGSVDQRWGRMVNGYVVEILDELDDGDPTTWFHPDALEGWQVIPKNHFVGSKFEDGKWYTGAEYFILEEERNPKAEDIAQPPEAHLGEVLEITLVNKGTGYSDDFTFKDQIDFPEDLSSHLVIEVEFDAVGGVESYKIISKGQGYKVGQGFKINRGFGFDWNRAAPNYAEFRISKVSTTGAQPQHTEAQGTWEDSQTIMKNVGVILVPAPK
jgi:hypothetical protein